MLTETSDVNGVTTYGYSDNGEQISKVNAQTGETVAYTYNLEGRLSTANIARTEDGQPVEIHSNYVYNHSGIRVSANSIVTDPNTQQQLFDKSRTFLVDSRNHTGYAQVLEEHDGVSPTPRVSYVLADDVLGQTTDTGGTKWFAYDGHGSTRLLTDTTGAITDRLSYDAYGVMLAWHGEAPGEARRGQPNVTNPVNTDLTYSGEQFDAELGMGYNRARYYDMQAGVWNRQDSSAGKLYDPQSLHKYAYCHLNPVMGIDPSGEAGILVVRSIPGNHPLLEPLPIPHRGTHSQIAFYKDAINYTTYGTWGYAHSPARPKGLRIDDPIERRSEKEDIGDSRSKYIDDDQEARANHIVQTFQNMGDNAWTKWKPCSYFASTLWNDVTGESLRDRHLFPVPYSDPNVLAKSIRKANRDGKGAFSSALVEMWKKQAYGKVEGIDGVQLDMGTFDVPALDNILVW